MTKFHQSDCIKITQVTLGVTNIERALTFYRDVLKFKVSYLNNHSVGLSTKTGDNLIILKEILGATRPHRHAGLYHVALLLPSRQDLGMMLHHLIESGYPISGLSDHQVSEAIYLDDPDGNGIEIYADRATINDYDWHQYPANTLTVPLDYHAVLQSSDGANYEKIPDDTIIGHLHLHVANLQVAKSFFVETIGFVVKFDWGTSASFLASGGYHHHLGLNTWNGLYAKPIKSTDVGLHSYKITMPKKYQEKLGKIYEQGKESSTYTFVDPNQTQLIVEFI